MRLFILALCLIVAACSGTSSSGSPGTTGSPASPSSSALPSQPPYAGSFDDLPFTLDLPEGWVFGSNKTVARALEAWRADLGDATVDELLRLGPSLASQFVAFQVESTDEPQPSVAGNTIDTSGFSDAVVLDELERQNVDGVASLPGIVGVPTSDRLTLRVGETVRVRWRNVVDDPTGGRSRDTSSIGYAFVIEGTAVTFVFSAMTSTVGAHEPEWERIVATFEWTGPAAPTPEAVAPGKCDVTGIRSGVVVLQHQAPEVEAILPSVVSGRPLATWSLRGRCSLSFLVGAEDAVDALIASVEPADPRPIDLADLVYGVAGRSDVESDPPYFVFAASRLDGEDEIALAIVLLFGGARFHDLDTAGRLGDYEARTIAGRDVYVGTADMLDQDEHQRGRPYLYQTDDWMFLVITDDEAWAADAIGQLP